MRIKSFIPNFVGSVFLGHPDMTDAFTDTPIKRGGIGIF